MPTKNLVPQNNGEGGIGTSLKNWGAGYFKNLFINNQRVSNPSTVFFNPTNTLSFPKTEKNYLVTLVWDGESTFSDFGPITQHVNNVGKSYWVKEDSKSNLSQISWEVFIPDQSLNGYNFLQLSPNVVAYGLWNDLQNFSPSCFWLPPALIL